MAGKTTSGGGYEKSDADVRRLAWLLLTLMIGVVLAASLMLVLYGRFAAQMAKRQPPPATLAGVRATTPPEPRLQNTPFDELRRMRADEDAALSSYGWVDKPAGIVRLPIDKALDMAAAGIPSAGTSSAQMAGSRAGLVLLYNNSKVDLDVWNEPEKNSVRIAPGGASEVAFFGEQWIHFGMMAYRYQIPDPVLKALGSIAQSEKLQAERDGRLYLVPQGSRFPVTPLPAQPPGFPLVPQKKADLT
ncbi:MAG TPA: hypothetical protein VFW45_01405 [Candidatus Polarisedimenticolia bacterium]|nr:hypothetical protein [Candidatus Polarisedimenticolia bacterium]